MTGIDKDIDSRVAQSQGSDTSMKKQEAELFSPTSYESPLAFELDGLLSSYDYELPEEQIAQTPLPERDRSRLLVVAPTHHTHKHFYNLPNLLQPGDLLVLNNTRVIPARLYGRKSTGAPVEVLLLEEQQHHCWLALVKPGRRLKLGAKILFAAHQDTRQSPVPLALTKGEIPSLPTLSATVVGRDEATNGRLLQFDVPTEASLTTMLEQYGQIPLPPYITNTQASPEQYQTIYAQANGAIAAPTAGLHFTEQLLQQCKKRGIEQTSLTLHVGVGTFRPVEVDNVTDHKMHGEWVEVPESTVEQIRETKAKGGRVIAVGTTVVRALESAAMSGELQPFRGKTELFIYPGYQWRVVEGLITNFHLPRSSLLLLVSAMIGRQRLLDLYKEAIAHQYRFYSFGDAMLILPEARKVVNV